MNLVCRFWLAVALVAAAPGPKTSDKDLTKEERKSLDNITPYKGFAYFSGNTERVNRHPAMFGFADEDGVRKLHVIGHSCDEEFEVKDFDKAIKRYKELLKERGFQVK